MELPVVLSYHNLRRTIPSPLEDFTFAFRNCSYKSTIYQAVFLSPLLHSRILADPFYNEFSFDMNDTKNLFPNFLSLAKGQPLEICPSSLEFYIKVAEVLQNYELAKQIHLYFSKISISNVISLCNSGTVSDHEIEISFMAANIKEMFKIESFFSLPLEFIYAIFSSPSLKIDSQTAFDFIKDFINLKGPKYSVLLGTIDVKSLPSQLYANYLTLINSRFMDSNTSLKVSQILYNQTESITPSNVQIEVHPSTVPEKVEDPKDDLDSSIKDILREFIPELSEHGDSWNSIVSAVKDLDPEFINDIATTIHSGGDPSLFDDIRETLFHNIFS